MNKTSSLLKAYEDAAQSPSFIDDLAQRVTLQTLDHLRTQLIKATTPSLVKRIIQRSFGKASPKVIVRGIYLYGSVGRGKTWLMDLFYESLPFETKHRCHFHRLMQRVHTLLHMHTHEVEPLMAVAKDLAAEAKVICCDELFVNDITDAMLLAGLFEHLIDQGVTLVLTSNVPPTGLYHEGLQRQRFLPAIALLEKYCALVNLQGNVDYRLRQLTQATIYIQSHSATASLQLNKIFDALSDKAPQGQGFIKVEDRKIPVLRLSNQIVWFEFTAFCEGPRSQYDYISIAREFQSVIISEVPIFNLANEDAARRFISLVDEFYDQHVNLILSAAALPNQLYQGEHLKNEFERTASRLIEMQSEEYLAGARHA